MNQQKILGDLSRQLIDLKEANKRLDELKKINNKDIAVLNEEILQIMESEELNKCSTEFGSLTRKVEMYPSFNEDDGGSDAFFSWIAKTNAWEFIQRRINPAPVREMFTESGKLPPGISTYMKETLLTRISPKYKNSKS